MSCSRRVWLAQKIRALRHRGAKVVAPASQESWFALGETQHAGAEPGMIN